MIQEKPAVPADEVVLVEDIPLEESKRDEGAPMAAVEPTEDPHRGPTTLSSRRDMRVSCGARQITSGKKHKPVFTYLE